MNAKGVLVVDALEARGVRSRRSGGSVYVLFQIGTTTQRTRSSLTLTPSLRWKEDSQCRFDISPGVQPLLRVALMQSSQDGGLPICLGKGELSLIDIFYQREVDRWITLSPLGQLDVELTFYEVVPLVPQKVRRFSKKSTNLVVGPGAATTTATQKESQPVKKLMSSVDRVFEDDSKEELGRLRRLAKKVKRRYKESVASNYDSVHVRKPSLDMLITELKVSTSDKDLPEIPDDPALRAFRRSSTQQAIRVSPNALAPIPTECASSSPSSVMSDNTTFSRTAADLSSLSLDDPNLELDLNNLPYSASSIGTGMVAQDPKLIQLRKEHIKKVDDERKKKYVSLSPEIYALVDRLEKNMVTKTDFKIDCGDSKYNGDGTWGKGNLRDSHPTGAPPLLPPKIPVGMTSEEFFVLSKKQYIEYIKTIKKVGGI